MSMMLILCLWRITSAVPWIELHVLDSALRAAWLAAAMAKGSKEEEPGVVWPGQQHQASPFWHGDTDRLGPVQCSPKSYLRPNIVQMFHRRRRTRGWRRRKAKWRRYPMRREGRLMNKRQVDTLTNMRLQTIHPNPGPKKRGKRSQLTNRTYINRKMHEKRWWKWVAKRQKRAKEEVLKKEERRIESEKDANRQPRIVTWNIQKTALRENNRRRLKEIVQYCMKNRWDVVMFTEVTSAEEGFFWIGEDEQKSVIIHGKKAAILLIGEWAQNWIDQGSQRWLGNRVAAVKVNHCRLICGYQPLWNYGDATLEAYRAELEQMNRTNATEWLIVGGDHNSSVGKQTTEVAASSAVGKYGLGQRNDAGNDLLRWCERHDLAWVNSFYKHNWRGTWNHPARHTWHELDGFMMRKQQMGVLVRKVKTVREDSYSDHRPKMLVLRVSKITQPKLRRDKPDKQAKVNWEALQEERTKNAFRDRTEEMANNQLNDPEVKWEKAAQVLMKAALEVCGKRRRQLTTPWMAGKDERLRQFRDGINAAIQKVRQRQTEHNEANTEESRERLDESKEERKAKRRERRITVRKWEREYWEEVIEQMRLANEQGRHGEMYRIWKQLGFRGATKAPVSTFFSPEEFKEHFSKVSEFEFENDAETWATALDRVKDNRNRELNKQAAESLEQTPSAEEIRRAMKEMKDRAPGEDGVRISYIRNAAEKLQDYVIRLVQNMFEKNLENWEEVVETGLVIPLFKKGDRKNRNNYRGVCLLSMGSRILSRVLATRLRCWAEEINLLDDNQQGFRKGRSTMDATQIMVRMQEEVSEKIKDTAANGMRTDDGPNDPGAVLLDITKAYPRINRPALWMILEKAETKNKCLRTQRNPRTYPLQSEGKRRMQLIMENQQGAA